MTLTTQRTLMNDSDNDLFDYDLVAMISDTFIVVVICIESCENA